MERCSRAQTWNKAGNVEHLHRNEPCPTDTLTIPGAAKLRLFEPFQMRYLGQKWQQTGWERRADSPSTRTRRLETPTSSSASEVAQCEVVKAVGARGGEKPGSR